MTTNMRRVLFSQFDSLKTDEARWKWMSTHSHRGITVCLDNDDTFATFNDDKEGQFVMEFDEYIGWTDGVLSLLKAIGISAEQV